jgi:hypothetical protein
LVLSNGLETASEIGSPFFSVVMQAVQACSRRSVLAEYCEENPNDEVADGCLNACDYGITFCAIESCSFRECAPRTRKRTARRACVYAHVKWNWFLILSDGGLERIGAFNEICFLEPTDGADQRR